MRNFPLYALAASVLLAAPATSAQDNGDSLAPRQRTVHISIDPSASLAFGHTTYRMDIEVPAAPGELSRLISELEFPLDQIMGGLAVHVQSFVDDIPDWEFVASAYTSINDPGGTMYDSDWMTVVGGFDGKFSYTESEAEGSSTIIDGEFSKRIFGSDRTSVGGLGGFRYQKISQNVDNFTGWQLDTLGNRYDFSVSNTPALTYEVTYKMPRVGLYALFASGNSLHIRTDVSWSPVFASDDDDHILRNKQGLGDGTGNGILARLNATYAMARHRSGARPFIGFRAELLTLKVDGSQTQRWYDDEVVGGEVIVPAGTSFSDIPHEFTSTQYQFGLRFGFAF